MKNLFLISSFLLLTAVSCKEDEPKPYCVENPGNCQSVTDAKKYFAFKVGSWWVYEEENSGQRDSLYVYESSIDPNSYQFNIRIKSSSEGFLYHYWPYFVSLSGCDVNGSVNKKCLFVKKSKALPGDFISEGECFFLNAKEGDFETVPNPYYSNNKIIINQVLSTYTLGNLSFQKTFKIHELASLSEDNQSTNHYFSENIGLVRKELLEDNEIWNLVNYHIEQ